MIRERRIDTLEGILPLITEQEYRPDMDRYRGHYVYRGLPDAGYAMVTSLRRNCKHLAKELEGPILKNFTKYAAFEETSREGRSIEGSVWRQMMLGQHHGLPTRLLDWSHSPLIALHFAMTENDMDAMEDHDCAVWRIDMAELATKLPESFRREADRLKTVVFTVDMMDRCAPTTALYDSEMGDSAMAVIEPPSSDPRIVTQYSFFSAVPMGMDSIEGFLDRHTENTVKYVISRELRWRVRDMLDEFNMSERIVYPGLDGLTRWITRHYFVKTAGSNV